MNTCNGCKWWSDKMAQSIALGPIEAVCLNPASKEAFGKFQPEYGGCKEYEEGAPVDGF